MTNLAIKMDVIQNEDVTAVRASLNCFGSGMWISKTAVGTAKRHSVDKADPQLGIELATGRALRQLGRELLKDGNKKVNRQKDLHDAEVLAKAERKAASDVKRKALEEADKSN